MRTVTRLLTATALASVAVVGSAPASFAETPPPEVIAPLTPLPPLPPLEPVDPDPGPVVPELELHPCTWQVDCDPVEPPFEILPIDPCIIIDCDDEPEEPETEEPTEPATEEPEEPATEEPEAPTTDPDPTADDDDAGSGTTTPQAPTSTATAPATTSATSATAQPAPQVMADDTVPSLDLTRDRRDGPDLALVLAAAVLGAGLAGSGAAVWMWRRSRG